MTAVHPKPLLPPEQFSGQEPPDELLCPITFELMEDPVFAADGHTYERRAIQQSIDTGNMRSPITNAPLENGNLTQNIRMKTQIANWKQRNRGAAGLDKSIKTLMCEAIACEKAIGVCGGIIAGIHLLLISAVYICIYIVYYIYMYVCMYIIYIYTYTYIHILYAIAWCMQLQ